MKASDIQASNYTTINSRYSNTGNAFTIDNSTQGHPSSLNSYHSHSTLPHFPQQLLPVPVDNPQDYRSYSTSLESHHPHATLHHVTRHPGSGYGEHPKSLKSYRSHAALHHVTQPSAPGNGYGEHSKSLRSYRSHAALQQIPSLPSAAQTRSRTFQSTENPGIRVVEPFPPPPLPRATYAPGSHGLHDPGRLQIHSNTFRAQDFPQSHVDAFYTSKLYAPDPIQTYTGLSESQIAAFAVWSCSFIHTLVMNHISQLKSKNRSYPDVGTIQGAFNRIEYIITYAPIGPRSILLAMWYINNLPLNVVDTAHQEEFGIEPKNEALMVELFVVGCMLATKWLDDASLRAIQWHMVSTVPVKYLNKLETSVLEAVKWDITFRRSDWSGWLTELRDHYACPDFTPHPHQETERLARSKISRIVRTFRKDLKKQAAGAAFVVR